MNYWSYISRILRPHRRRLAAALGTSIAQMLIGLSGPLMIAVLIDLIVTEGRYDLLAPLMILFMSIPILGAGIRVVNGYLVELLGQRLVFDIRLDLYRRVQRLSCAFLQNTPTGKLMERLRGDVNQLQQLLTSQSLTLAVDMLTGLLTLVVMFMLSAKLTLLVLAAIGLYVANYKWFVRRIRKVQRRQRRQMDMLSGLAQERLSATVAVKAFGNERREMRRFVRRDFTASRVQHRFRMLNNSYYVMSAVIGGSTQLMVLLLGTVLAVHGHLTFGTVTAMAAFTTRLISPAIQLAEISNVLQQARVSLDRIFELMQADPDPVDQKGLRLTRLEGEVAFQMVGFHYKPREPVLHYFNLHVRPHQTVALVGETGCGKTTITNLLYRYYEPQAGHLEIDGHDISTFDTRWYRRQLALVPQEPIVFDTTIAENIAYGRPDATAEQLRRAVRAAELQEVIDGLSDGLNTRLGDRGITLSVGERQRLCIARAIVADPAILILDEATSSLDPHSESLIQLALKRVMARRTCFVIAHRLSTIVEADLIVVMDEGRPTEVGSHLELVNRPGGRYRQLYETQVAKQRRVEIA